jgi:hypothetical protein
MLLQLIADTGSRKFHACFNGFRDARETEGRKRSRFR